jgi:hypothetical protein
VDLDEILYGGNVIKGDLDNSKMAVLNPLMLNFVG